MKALRDLKTPRRELGKKGVKAAVRDLYRTFGAVVWNTSGAGGKRWTANSPGLPDLIAFFPRRKVMLFHEAKAVKGVLSEEQGEFAVQCAQCRQEYVAGGEAEARQALQRLGITTEAR